MEKLRKEILASAKDLFLDVGYKHTSIEMIAEKGGFDVSSIRALFQNKVGLVEELLKELSDPFMSMIEFVSGDEKDIKSFIRKSLTQYNRILTENPDYVHLFHHLMHDDPQMMIRLMKDYFFMTDFYQRIRHFQESGQLTITNPEVLDSFLDAVIFFPHISRPIMENFVGEESIDDFYENYLESALTIFENGLYQK